MLNACAEGSGYAVMGGDTLLHSLASEESLARWGTFQQVEVHVLTYWLAEHFRVASLKESAKQFRFSISKPLDHL